MDAMGARDKAHNGAAGCYRDARMAAQPAPVRGQGGAHGAVAQASASSATAPATQISMAMTSASNQTTFHHARRRFITISPSGLMPARSPPAMRWLLGRRTAQGRASQLGTWSPRVVRPSRSAARNRRCVSCSSRTAISFDSRLRPIKMCVRATWVTRSCRAVAARPPRCSTAVENSGKLKLARLSMLRP